MDDKSIGSPAHPTGGERESDIKHITESEGSAEQLTVHQQAIVSNAIITLAANLSRDVLYYGLWKDDAGTEVPLTDILGFDIPCSYEKYIHAWNDRLVRGEYNVDTFIGSTDRKYLLEMFERGSSDVTFDYEAKTVSGRSAWLRRRIHMRRDNSGNVIAYTSVTDISSLATHDLREAAYVRAMATEYDSITIISIGEDKNLDKVTLHSRLTGEIADLIDDETADEVEFSKKLGHLLKFIHPEDRDRFYANTRRERVLESFDAGKNHVLDFRLMKKDGTHVHYQMRFFPLRDYDGRVDGIIACMRNINDEIRREFGIRKALEDAKIAAEAANEAKSTFLFNVSHDIRTPLNAIIGFIDIASKYIDDRARVEESLEKVRTASLHLLSLVNDVLDMSRVESEQVKLNEEPMFIDTTFDNLYSIVAGSAEEKNITISLLLSPSLEHHWIYADRLRLMRILTNVVSNSVKYTNPGGKIDILIEELPCERDGHVLLRCTVADTGIGMSKDYLAHIFEPFTRAESATISGVNGSGLGMAITKSLVELMGGKISIDSEPGAGTTVIIEFESRIAEAVDPRDELPKKLTVDIKGKSILLVDDNELNREIATEILEEEGVIVDTAEDGDIAVEIMRSAADGQYDLILMDIQMPRMNGYDATRAIRQLPNSYAAGIPIIAMTANAFEEDRRNAFEAGMDGHISKPIDVPKLLNTIADILK